MHLCRWPEEDSDNEPLEDTTSGPLLQTFTFDEYESGGVWYDHNLQPCLPVQVRWGEDDASVLMLYSKYRRRTAQGIQALGELVGVGAGEELESAGAAGILLKGQPCS